MFRTRLRYDRRCPLCKRTLAGEEVKYLVLIFFKRFSLPFRWKALRTKLVIRTMATTGPGTAAGALDLGGLELGRYRWSPWSKTGRLFSLLNCLMLI